MASSADLPGFVAKRKMLFNRKTSTEKLRALGEQFMAAGRHDDALEFFQRSGSDDLTGSLADAAMESGNVSLFMRACKVLGRQITRPEWGRIGEVAEKAGVYTGARLAYERAGRADDAARASSLIPGFVPPEAEPEEIAEETAEPAAQ